MANPARRVSSSTPPLVAVAAAVLALLLSPACSHENQVDTGDKCSFTLAQGAGFCPSNTHPSAIVANCESASAGGKCLKTNVSGCFVNCVPAKCGDGFTDPGEECDLGVDNGAGKGCDSTCHTTHGMSCGTNGDLRCAPDNSAVQVCRDNLWQPKTSCSANQVCSAAALQCVDAPGYCPTPGLFQCAGDVSRQVCSPANRWTDAPCPLDTPLCASPGGVVTCQAGGNVLTNGQYRAKVIVGSVVGTTGGPGGRAILGEPPVH